MLHEVTDPAMVAVMLAFHVTKGEARMLCLMAPGGEVPMTTLHDAARLPGCGNLSNTSHHIKRLRRKTDLLFKNVRGIGYMMSEASAARVRAAITAAHSRAAVSTAQASAGPDHVRELKRRGFSRQAIASRLHITYAAVEDALSA